MNGDTEGFRSVKIFLKKVLHSDTPPDGQLELFSTNLKKLVSPIISFLCSLNPVEKWRSVSLLGMVACRIAKNNMEDARVIVRRLMWHLNDESGGIGWGCAESIGEILRCNKILAKEFSHILISYIDPDGNLLDNDYLVEGALWGIARLSQVYPENCHRAEKLCYLYLKHERPLIRLYSALILRFLKGDILLQNDETPVGFYWYWQLKTTRICDVFKAISE